VSEKATRHLHDNIEPKKPTKKQEDEYLLASINSDPQPSYVSRSTVIKEDRPMDVDKYNPLIRKHAKPEIDSFLDVKSKTRIIIFDVETNGLHSRCSVLSCSAIKFYIDPNNYEMTEIDRFNRYYYPVEEYNREAIYVNRLTKDVITEKRGDCTYPDHFCMDSAFETFCSDTERFIAHSISFDAQFIPFMGGKKKFCTMMTNMNIVASEFLEWKNEWKWPKLSETAIHYCIPFHESDLHNSMYDTQITTNIFSKMLDAIKNDLNGIAGEFDNSMPDFNPQYNFTWQLRNVNESLASQCKVGEVLNLTKESETDNVHYVGVVTNSGEHLGDIESSDLQNYGLIFGIDHGAKVSVKIKQIFTKNTKIESINIKVSIGNMDRDEQKTLFSIDRNAKGIIAKAKTLETTNHEAAISLYRKAIGLLNSIDNQCEKHFSTWRQQKFPINRLSLLLERKRRYQECLEEIETYERVVDKVGLYAGEKEILAKRKERMQKAIKKYPANSKMIEAKNGNNTEIAPPQDVITVNDYQEDSDFERFLKEGSGFIFSVYGPQEVTYVGMSVKLWIPKVKNPDEVYIYPRSAPYSLGTVPFTYSDLIINHLLEGMSYDARIVECAYNTCKIKCRLISKEENELRKEEYKTSLIKEFKKPYTPKKPIILNIVAKKKKAVKVGDKLIIEFVDLDSFGLYPKFYSPWHIKFLNQAGVTIGIFADDENTIERILKAHYNSYLFDIEVVDIENERNSAWKGYPTRLLIKPFKHLNSNKLQTTKRKEDDNGS
jgi:DNA polymerase III epsilon subunit-like protein